MQTFLIILTIIVSIIVLFNIYARSKFKNMAPVENNEKIITLTDKNFNQQTKGKLVLVDFWAEWCAPCRMMAPILNELANELPDDINVGKLNVEHFQSLAQQFNVRSIPTMIVYQNGNEVNRYVGLKSKDFLQKELYRLRNTD